MRILKILCGNDSGGIYTCEKQYIKYWRSKNIKIDAIIIGKGNSFEVYKGIVNSYYLFPELNANYSGGLKTILNNISLSKKYASTNVNEINFTNSYDVLIYRRPNYIHIAGELRKKFNLKLLFWHMPSSVNSMMSYVYYNYFLHLYRIEPIANSVFTKKTIGKKCKEVVYPGFNKDRIKLEGENFRKELNIDKKAIVFGSAATLNQIKAQDLFILGMIKANLFQKNVHCIFAGGPTDSEFVKYLYKISEPFKNQIHFLGPISDVAKFYDSIDIYVNSRRNAEPFGISIAEALGTKLPVIAFYKGGPSETVKEGFNGWLIKKPSIDGYAEVFKKSINNFHKWSEMGKNSLKMAEKFEANFNAEKFLLIINKRITKS